MHIDWPTVLLQLITSGATLTGLAFLLKSLFTHQFQKDLERYKRELQLELQNEHVRFSRLHEKRAEVIDELYKRIVRFRRECHLLLVAEQTDVNDAANTAIKNAEQDDLSNAADAAAKNFDRGFTKAIEAELYFGENALYLPPELKDKFRKLFTEGIVHPLQAVAFKAGTDQLLRIHRPHWRSDVMKGLAPTLREQALKMDSYMLELEEEFQKLLSPSPR